METRKICRKYYRELRDTMPQEIVEAKSRAICEKILLSKEFQEAGAIFAYYPLGKEVNCLFVLEQALKMGKRVVLPRTDRECQMEFYEIQSLEDVEEGSFHVMEPKSDCKIFIPDVIDCDRELSEKNMLVLVPGVVFDCEGNRYGYGKGYYDRYFARFPKLRRMALAYTEQISEEPLACLATDIKMNIILTEEKRIDINK